MAQGIFIGLSQTELTELRDAALAAIKTGRFTSVASAAQNAGVDYGLTPQQILVEVRYAEARASSATGSKRNRVYSDHSTIAL